VKLFVAVCGVIEQASGWTVSVYTSGGRHLTHRGKADGSAFTRAEAERLAAAVEKAGQIDPENWRDIKH